MTILVDTNILLRVVDQSAAEHSICVDALRRLDDLGHELAICAQVMIEFWSVATRPLKANGLGLEPKSAAQFLNGLCNSLRVLPEPPDVASVWRQIVERYSVISKQAHDARLVALMQAHNLPQLLTLNTSDFSRYSQILLLNPQDAIALKK